MSARLDKKNLLLFFDRPTEPCFMPKGTSVLQIPDKYFPDRYKSAAAVISNRFGEEGTPIPLRNIALPDVSEALRLPYREQFSLFVPKHNRLAKLLIDIFMKIRDVDDLMSLCSYCQLRINPYMFNYCLTVALLHRKDTKGLNIPTYVETFPSKFMDPRVFRRAREIMSIEEPQEREPIEIPRNYTASDAEPEQAVAYFREDIGINLHHWHWHLVYPIDAEKRAIVDKDRRGELFYYMHHQIMARYNTERLCNNLARVRPINDYRAPMEEAYFPKLNSQVASRTWPPRFAGSTMSDIRRPQQEIHADVYEMETWRDRLIEAINNMAIHLPQGRVLPLDEETGIDILGNLLEASALSLNPGYYGNLHNMGHNFISYVHDPEDKYLERFGVMGESSTAMRDPIFYRWHAHVDNIFTMYKNKLPVYGSDRLNFPGISVSSIQIKGSAGSNVLSTQWEKSTVDLGRGVDFAPRTSVLARITHLQHDEFVYFINVNNTSGCVTTGTVRIFIAPVLDENRQPLTFEDQRPMMIELDKFTQSIPTGTSTFQRKSVLSSVTIPYERVFRDQSERPGDAGSEEAAEFDFCGCGWPHYMLLPKGTKEGYPMVLFCMISNWKDDKVVQETLGTCSNAASYCGIRDGKYPDKRPMGFPFDRPAKVNTLPEFLTPNMAVTDISIKFSDTTRIRQRQ